MWTREEKLLLVGASLVLLIVGFLLKENTLPDEAHTPILVNQANEGIKLTGTAP
jgi:hypothetical protein